MNTPINTYSKEAIKARMLQNAVKLWGLKSTNAIDPFVRLLMEAFSTEVFKVNNEVQAINARILEKMAKLLTPSLYTSPRPAHAIAFTSPMDLNEVLPSHSEFFIKRQFPSSVKAATDLQIEIPFTPVDHIRLVHAKTDILFTGSTCYSLDGLNKMPVARIPGSTLGHRKIVLGIDVSAYISSEQFPSSLNVYCSNPTFEHLDFVYKLLPFIKISNSQTTLRVKSGLSYGQQEQKSGYEEIFHAYAIQTRIEEDIKTIYAHRFIELAGLTYQMISGPGELPEVLASLKGNQIVEQLVSDKHYLWLELEFPVQYSMEILENFSFVLNAFPVYNKAWKSKDHVLNEMGNNIPLSTNTGEHFLYVEEVVDGFGRKYEEIPFTNEGSKKGLYTVRSGGMERFSERDALDTIAHILELTRDEGSAFGILDRDKVEAALKTMATQMKALNQNITNAEREMIQKVNYVIVDPIEGSEHIKTAYWITHCALANHIRADTLLMQQQKTQSGSNRTITLLTESQGGEKAQKGADAIQAYKYALTTRDKIISIEDVKSFCRLLLKDDLKEVRITRGTMISSKPKEGFLRTINIEIVPSSYAFYGSTYWDNMAISIKNQIVARAIDGIEYQVQVVNEDIQ